MAAPNDQAAQLAAFRTVGDTGALADPDPNLFPVDDPEAVEGEGDAVEGEGEAVEGEGDGEHAAAQPPRRADPQKRIAQLIGRQRSAERRADAAEARLAALEGRQRPTADQGATNPPQQDLTPGASRGSVEGAPDPGRYPLREFDPAYQADLSRFYARQEVDRRDRERDQHTRLQDFQQRVAKYTDDAAAEMPDFREVVLETAANGEWPLSQFLTELALDTPGSAPVLYELAQNPAEAERVVRMTPVRQAAWFASKLSGRAPAQQQNPAAPRQVRTTRAPTPPAYRVRGGATSQGATPDTADFGAFESMVGAAQRRARQN